MGSYGQRSYSNKCFVVVHVTETCRIQFNSQLHVFLLVVVKNTDHPFCSVDARVNRC